MKLRQYLAENDLIPTIYATNDFGRNISRNEIETSLTDAGYNLPTKNVLFYIVDSNNKAYLVRYFVDIDKYGCDKLTMR